MKRKVFVFLFCIVYTTMFAQQSFFVSAIGNDNNDGLSEKTPLKTFFTAVEQALAINGKVIVIGTLNLSETTGSFSVINLANSTHEITIAGKPNATAVERAVLSAKGSGKPVLTINGNARIRLEYIEISGGEGGEGVGLTIMGGSEVVLGPGAVVRDNSSIGITISESSTCIIDGGEVRDNNFCGISVASSNRLILRNGTIRDNYSPINGGGVCILPGGTFTMSGGTITGNEADQPGGGVAVLNEGRFEQTGGIISNNISYQAGGGVVVAPSGTFNKSGGTIRDNIAIQAGGGLLVFFGGNFYQTGGTISGNTAPINSNIHKE